MAASDGDDKTLEASARRLEEARKRGDVAISREGSTAGLYLAALIAVLLTGEMTARRIGDILLPLLDQPDAFLDMTQQGLGAAAGDVARALAVAILPFFGLVIAGAFVPHLLQNSVAVAGERLVPKLSHLSPAKGLKRIFSPKALFEFGKSLLKLGVVGAVCFAVARPLYEHSIDLVSVDLAILPQMLQQSVVALLLAVALVAVLIAGVDVPYQHWAHRRRLRMSIQEMKDELRSTEGDPYVRARLRRLRRRRWPRRMMQEVTKATVVVTNPTHFAVALKYERGKDLAPFVVAKGADLIALRIRQTAKEHHVAIVESALLARALHASVEIGDAIPQEHFEAVAKIIGLVWAQRNPSAS